MKYIVEQTEDKTIPKKEGGTFTVSEVIAKDESGKLITFQTKAGAKVGDTLTGEMEDKPWGKTLKQAYSGGGGRSFESPEKQASIERQNSLTNSVNYCIAKAKLHIGLGNEVKAKEELTGKHVLEVAMYFQRYSAGKVVFDTTPKETETPVETKIDSEVPSEVLEDQETINLDDIPDHE